MARLLHFTDIHLRHHQPGTAGNPARLSRAMPVALDRLRDRIREFAPDVVVMTGDVLDVPDKVIASISPDDRAVGTWLDEAVADFTLVKDWFESLGVDYLVIPGNHDHEAAYRQVFGGPPAPRDLAGLRFFCFWDELADDRQPRRTGPMRENFYSALRDDEHDCPQVHIQHYMIDPPTFARGWNYEYKGAAEMKQAVESSGRVRAVLSGHYHPGSLVTGANGVIHSLPQAFCETPHRFRVYEIVEGTATQVSDHALDA